MRFSDAKKHKVVSTATAETVGRVDELVVDPAQRRVLALKLKKTDSGDTLLWSDLIAFGADAATIADTDKITDATPAVQALEGKDHHLLGKRLLTTGGDEIGKVTDAEFDPETGALISLLSKDEEIAGDRLIGIGSYAVVVDG
jgi:sporulation protein YlmC with PRC-barrel domain